jgi:hypothetical protein
LPCSLRKRTPLAATSTAKPKGETMSNPDQAPGYDGEPTYAQNEYNEYLRWREETEPQTR